MPRTGLLSADIGSNAIANDPRGRRNEIVIPIATLDKVNIGGPACYFVPWVLNPCVRLMSLPRKANGPPSLLLEPRFDSIPSDPPSVLLIGCGAVGSVVAQHLCASDDVAEVILADRDGELAKRTASRLKSPKARATQLDASDGEGLRRAMRGCGLVINTALPQFNRAVQAAALAEGLNYLDPANDSRDPFVDSDTWKAAGLTALCAMGEDPGLSNVFARYAADGMERVDSIKVRDGGTASGPDCPFIRLFSPETFVEETLAPSRI